MNCMSLPFGICHLKGWKRKGGGMLFSLCNKWQTLKQTNKNTVGVDLPFYQTSHKSILTARISRPTYGGLAGGVKKRWRQLTEKIDLVIKAKGLEGEISSSDMQQFVIQDKVIESKRKHCKHVRATPCSGFKEIANLHRDGQVQFWRWPQCFISATGRPHVGLRISQTDVWQKCSFQYWQNVYTCKIHAWFGTFAILWWFVILQLKTMSY